jgi:transposase
MRQIREALRLKYALGQSERLIGQALGIGRTTVGDYLRRAAFAGLSWPLPDDLDDAALEARLFAQPGGRHHRPQPDWSIAHRELKRPGVTLRLLWEEYRTGDPDGYSLSRYCQLYHAWRAQISPVMRQRHIAGEKMFVDYAGHTIEIFDPETGEIRQAQIFVAVLGASSYTYAEATWSQQLQDWIGSHVRALTFFGRCPKIVVPDNLKSGVTKPCFFEPKINPTYADLAAHYGVALIPARPRKPRDKAKVEVGVQIVTRLLARLRHRRFTSLATLNQAIFQMIDELNRKPSRHLGASRLELFHQIDKPDMQPLPAEPYEFAEWKQCRVGIDYHVEIEKHYYSVPHGLNRQQITARMTATTIELFHRGRRVAVHLRSRQTRRHTTIDEHMPSAHRRYAGWTHERLREDAAAVGPDTACLVDAILRKKPHPEQGFRACLGILRLRKTYGPDRLEAACERALLINGLSYTSVASILKNNLERRKPDEPTEGPTIHHANLRGSSYVH